MEKRNVGKKNGTSCMIIYAQETYGIFSVEKKKKRFLKNRKETFPAWIRTSTTRIYKPSDGIIRTSTTRIYKPSDGIIRTSTTRIYINLHMALLEHQQREYINLHMALLEHQQREYI